MSDWQTKLIHSEGRVLRPFRSLSTPIERGSTVVFPCTAQILDEADPYEEGYSYGLSGTPTTLELATRICELEGGFRTILTPSGLSAITMTDFAFLSAGDHVLIPANVYGPNRELAEKFLARFGITSTIYPANCGAEIANYFEPNTKLVWTEVPGSITMEIPDLPAIVKVAHERGALVALDNTWAAGVYYDTFAHGVDIAMQALTKYVGGHSDVLLGSVTVARPELWPALRQAQALLGIGVSPDEASLALRGIKTMALRLDHSQKAALELAQWLESRPELESVLHPALPSFPDHALWQRDFTGSSGVFSILFREGTSRQQVHAFIDALKFFALGYSWGGVASVVMTYDFSPTGERAAIGSRLVRLSVGLESVADLKADLEQAFAAIQ